MTMFLFKKILGTEIVRCIGIKATEILPHVRNRHKGIIVCFDKPVKINKNKRNSKNPNLKPVLHQKAQINNTLTGLFFSFTGQRVCQKSFELR